MKEETRRRLLSRRKQQHQQSPSLSSLSAVTLLAQAREEGEAEEEELQRVSTAAAEHLPARPATSQRSRCSIGSVLLRCRSAGPAADQGRRRGGHGRHGYSFCSGSLPRSLEPSDIRGGGNE